MTRQRSDSELILAAAQIDEALAAGLTRDQVVALVIARNGWRAVGHVPWWTATAALREALGHPAAEAWDAIFVRRARHELQIGQAATSGASNNAGSPAT